MLEVAGTAMGGQATGVAEVAVVEAYELLLLLLPMLQKVDMAPGSS